MNEKTTDLAKPYPDYRRISLYLDRSKFGDYPFGVPLENPTAPNIATPTPPSA